MYWYVSWCRHIFYHIKHIFLLLQCSFLPKFSIHIETKYEDNKGSNDSVSMMTFAKVNLIILINHDLSLNPSVWEKGLIRLVFLHLPGHKQLVSLESSYLQYEEMKVSCTQLPFCISVSTSSFSKHNMVYVCEFSIDERLWRMKKRLFF